MKYTPENTNIAVIGGGNIGTQFACVCAAKGYRVSVLSSKPELYSGTLEVVDEYEKVTTGKLYKVSADMGEAIEGCHVIFVTLPAFMLRQTADRMLPYIKADMNICVLPGTGGAEFAFRECIKAGATLFGLQRVPSVARLEQYGRRVRCEGLRNELCLASIPGSKAEELAAFMSDLWGIPCVALPNYLSVTLTPSNPILHTTRLRTLFADYEEGKVYDRNPLFYGEWSDASSELLIACDGELQEMLGLMDKMDLSNVRSLKIHYESDTVEAMTKKLSGISSRISTVWSRTSMPALFSSRTKPSMMVSSLRFGSVARNVTILKSGSSCFPFIRSSFVTLPSMVTFFTPLFCRCLRMPPSFAMLI